jgi:hypothetical protein
MKTEQTIVKKPQVAAADVAKLASINPHLVFVFGSVSHFTDEAFGPTMKQAFPKSTVIGCTTAGEISSEGVSNNTSVFTAINFAHPDFKSCTVKLNGADKCKDTGVAVANALKAPNLKAIFLLGQGINVNGTPLVDGIRSVVGDKVTLTGGLAGDGGAFKETWTILNGEVSNSHVVAFGIYGEGVEIACGSLGGWKPFGPARRVTKCENNVLYQLDGEPALAVYKKYLGDDAKGLPGSGLRYPFAILNDNEDETGLIRTILAVDEAAGSLTFAGDIPANGLLRLMHTDSSGLVTGAKGAASETFKHAKNHDGVGILISCVGRKLVMGDEIDEEVEAVQHAFGENNPVTGFYSYGEICPQEAFQQCKLHNQTMTITWFADKKAS